MRAVAVPFILLALISSPTLAGKANGFTPRTSHIGIHADHTNSGVTFVDLAIRYAHRKVRKMKTYDPDLKPYLFSGVPLSSFMDPNSDLAKGHFGAFRLGIRAKYNHGKLSTTIKIIIPID